MACVCVCVHAFCWNETQCSPLALPLSQACVYMRESVCVCVRVCLSFQSCACQWDCVSQRENTSECLLECVREFREFTCV